MGTVDVIMWPAEYAFPQCELGIKAAGVQGEIFKQGRWSNIITFAF